MQSTINEKELHDIRPGLSPHATSATAMRVHQDSAEITTSLGNLQQQQPQDNSKRYPLNLQPFVSLNNIVVGSYQNNANQLSSNNMWFPPANTQNAMRHVYGNTTGDQQAPCLPEASAQISTIAALTPYQQQVTGTTFESNSCAQPIQNYNYRHLSQLAICNNDYRSHFNYPHQQVTAANHRHISPITTPSTHQHSCPAPSQMPTHQYDFVTTMPEGQQTNKLIQQLSTCSSNSEASTKTAISSLTSSPTGSSSINEAEPSTNVKISHPASNSKKKSEALATKMSSATNFATIVSNDDDPPSRKSTAKKAIPTNDIDDEKLKTYLNQLVLASNVPFAYAIILVAFLITMIAATSIITILTIVLTITGYTAYPITENTFNTSLAIGVVCASFALALVTASLIVWRRHCQAAYYYLDEPLDPSRGTSSPQLSETYDDSEYGSIIVNDWAKHVQKLHTDGDIGFSREFEQIQQANQKNTALTCDHSQLPENKHKNRYINIVAYDHTRVILRPPLGGQKKTGYDYINANFIDGYNKPRAYIGTQGPLVSTFDDYWRMIWEQRVVIIVMITNLQERGRRKCDMYWPKEGTETYGYVQVKLLQEVVMATYTLRTFTVKNLKMKKRSVGSERTVYQYHYTNWPDHGVPDHPLPVLSFVRKSAAANPPGAGAIICHCSAGCGRSGTYIVIDAMLKQIRHRQSINVVDFLKHIRTQRNYLVQTEEQYIFIHDALVEALDSGETEIPSNFIAKYLQLLQTGNGAAIGASKTEQKGSNYSLVNGLCQPLPPISNSSSSNLLLANGAKNNKTCSQATTVSRSQSSQWSLLERQYRLVASFKAKDFCVVSALKPCNKIKNRTLNLIPLEAHRVHITPKPGTDGSDYINATFLMGFNHLHEFIVTQHPVVETFSDFWQMVYDHNSQTIVLLSLMDEQLLKEFPQFWPQKEDEVDYGAFKVKLTQESTLLNSDSTSASIVARDFIMRSNQDDYELQTRIIHCPGWPDTCGPLSSVFDLIRLVQQATHQQANQQRAHDGMQHSQTVTIGQEHEPQNGGPIIVVDKYGGTEAATFAVLTTLFKQINFEDAVDVYMYAKLAHLRRPGIWNSQDDYLFLYRAMDNYATELLAAQQAAQSQSEKQLAGSFGAQLSLPSLHPNQTMTLDRHNRNKSATSSIKHQTSTMRRPTNTRGTLQTKHQQQQQQQQQQQPLYQNMQQIQQQPRPTPTATVNHYQKNHSQAIANEFMQVQKQNSGQILKPVATVNATAMTDLNHNNVHYSLSTLPNYQQPQQQMSKGSPYNSAGSIGNVGSHQHLLAAGNQQSGGRQQPNASDVYLYSMQ